MDYRLHSNVKGGVEYALSMGPAPWSSLRQQEFMREWPQHVHADGDVLLLRPSGAVAQLHVEADSVVGVSFLEGETAREALLTYAVRPPADLQALVSDRYAAGRAFEVAVAETRIARRGKAPYVGATTGAMRVQFGMLGILEVSVDDGGVIEGHRWLEPDRALALMEEAASDKAFQVAPYALGVMTARTAVEATLFVQSVNGRIKHRRVHDGMLQFVASTRDGIRRFDFTLTQPEQGGLGTGTSPLFGLGQLVVFARAASRPDPANLDKLWATHTEHHRLQLLYGGLAAREALSLLPEGASTPPDASFQSHVGKRAFEKHPEWFTREAVSALATELFSRARRWERDVPAVLARSFSDVSTYLWRMGVFPDAVETSYRDWTVLGPGDLTQRIRVDIHGANPQVLDPIDIAGAAQRMVRALPTRPEGLCTAALRHVIDGLHEARAVRAELRQWVAPGAEGVTRAAFRPEVEPNVAAFSVTELDRIDGFLDTLISGMTAALEARGEAPPRAEVPGWPQNHRMRVLREMALGVKVGAAVQAIVATAPVVVSPYAKFDAGSQRAHLWFQLNLAEAENPVAMLGVVVDGEDRVLGRMLLEGSDALGQREHLDRLMGQPTELTDEQRHEANARAALAVLEAQVRPLLEALGRGDSAALEAVRPRKGDVALAFDHALAPKLEPVVLAAFESENGPRVTARPEQTHVDVALCPVGALAEGHPLSRAFPGAYKTLAQRMLAPGRVWVTWTYTEPDAERGMRYDGLVWLEDRWVWFPKPWRFVQAAGVA